MRSTMMDLPLQISRLLEHGSTVHGTAEVATWTGDGVRRTSFAGLGALSAQLAHALRDDLGVTGDDRVATFMWNNAEHLAAYCAVPSMGAVLHTLNIRLFPDQLGYIANHASDKVIIVDGTLPGRDEDGGARGGGRARRSGAAVGRAGRDPPVGRAARGQADPVRLARGRRAR